VDVGPAPEEVAVSPAIGRLFGGWMSDGYCGWMQRYVPRLGEFIDETSATVLEM